jgi:4-amino-4-deoxy-L-arabinose transferase-like glycosyltransferase
MTKGAKHIIILVFLSSLFFLIGNNLLSLTNPDEVFYAQTAKEMAARHSWLTPYLFDAPQFEKPIFLYWLLRLGFILFGISSFAARFFPALFAIFGVIAAYRLSALGYKDDKKAFMSALILMSSALYIGLGRTVFTDMIFTVFILLALVSFFWGYSCRERKMPGVLLFFVFSGLAVLTKGPIGFLIPIMTVVLFLLVKNELRFLLCWGSFWGFAAFLGISLPWYIVMINKYGQVFTHEFFYNDHFRRIVEAEHHKFDTWYFYPFSMIAYMFPWSLFVLMALVSFFRNLKRGSKDIHIFLACWIVVVFCMFQFAHSKLSSYILPLFPAISIITGDFVCNRISSKPKTRKNAYLLAFSMLVFLWAVLFMHAYAEPYASSKTSCEYLLKNYNINGYILCSKPFVRGVRYYTDKPVAALNINVSEDNFFSPHPIPFINTGEKLIGFLKKQPITYCVLKKSSVEEIKNLAGKSFNFTLLKIIGNQYIFVVSFNRNL